MMSAKPARSRRNISTKGHLKMKTSPVLFVGHGSPMNAIGTNPAREGWKQMGEYLGKTKVIVAVSAHWMTRGRCVRRSNDNPQVNDMYGFPPELYAVHYEPCSSVEIADKVIEALSPDAQVKNDWGIDHGVWSVLSNMYPQADVPVVMVSTDLKASPKEHYDVGKKLAKLREDGAMLVCSGNVVHNLRMVNWEMNDGYAWAKEFDKSIKQLIIDGNHNQLLNFSELKDAERAIPTPEHFYPLLTAVGALSADDEIGIFNDYCELGSMSMTSYVFSH